MPAIQLATHDGSPVLSTLAAAAPAFSSLDSTLGAWLLGTFFGLILQGVILNLAFTYYRTYTKDPLFMKIWVAAALLVETMNITLTMHASYYLLVTNYFQPLVLLGPPVWSMKLLPVPGSTTALISQTYLARRVWLLSKRYRLLVVVAFLLTLGFCGCYTAYTGNEWHVQNISDALKFAWLCTLGSSLIMGADVLLTSVLIYSLHSSRSGLRRTNSVIDIIIMYTVTTGLLISVFNVLNIIFSARSQSNGDLIFTAFSIVLTKLYTITLLVTLNSRQLIAQQFKGNKPLDANGRSVGFTTTATRSAGLHMAPVSGQLSSSPESSLATDVIVLSDFASTKEKDTKTHSSMGGGDS